MLRAEPIPGRTPSWSCEIEHDGPVVLVGQAAGDDADHARMPAALGQHEGGVLVRVELLVDLLAGGQLDAPFQRLPRGVELVDVLGQLQGPLRPVGHQQLDGQLRLAEPAGGVQPRGQAEGDVLALQPRLAVGVRFASTLATRISVATPSVGHWARLSRP